MSLVCQIGQGCWRQGHTYHKSIPRLTEGSEFPILHLIHSGICRQKDYYQRQQLWGQGKNSGLGVRGIGQQSQIGHKVFMPCFLPLSLPQWVWWYCPSFKQYFTTHPSRPNLGTASCTKPSFTCPQNQGKSHYLCISMVLWHISFFFF